MIEEILYKELNKQGDIKFRFTADYESVSENMVIMDKIRSSEKNKIYTSTFAFQSYGENKLSAMKLNDKVKSLVKDLILSDEIIGVDLDSDYDFTDTTTKKYRYQAVFTIKHY